MAEPIRPKDLPVAPSVPADVAIIIDNGSVVQKATPAQIADTARPLANQAEAEAGSDNAKTMTPLRTAQAIDARGYDGAIAGKEPVIVAGTTAQYWRGDKSWQTLDKGVVGLGNVDNTSDANKPISTATQTALDTKAPINSPTFTGTVSGITKSMVGLGNVDNTSDANKPVSTATQTALNAKEPTITAGTTAQYWRGDKSWQTLNKAAVGLSNVDNTSDANKPVSTAQQTAIDATTTFSHSTSYATGSVRKKLQKFIDVDDAPYNADPTGVADSYAAFNAAIAALPSTGGIIAVKGAAYRLETTLSWGSKNIIWDIGPNTVFTGAGTGFQKFPYMASNGAQLAVGPFIQSRSYQKADHPNGGVAAFNIEMIQPGDYGSGQSVGLYVGNLGAAVEADANNWAINCLTHAFATAGGTYQGIEIDANNDSPNANVIGAQITGDGSEDAGIALLITRASMKWGLGAFINKVADGIIIQPNSGGRGIIIGPVGNDPAAVGDTAITSRQLANNTDTIFLQRNTDTAPTGQFIRAVNAANSQNIFYIDVSGNMSMGADLRVSRSTTQYINLVGDSGANWLHSRSDPASAKLLVLAATTDGSNTTPSGGSVGISLRVLGTERLGISSTGAVTASVSFTTPSLSVTGTGGNILSGTYTPTLTSVANVSASTAYACQYMRVGNTITVSGKVDITPTAASTNTRIGISLPVASALTADSQLAGLCHEWNLGTNVSGPVGGDATNDRAELQINFPSTGARGVMFQFTYRVL